MSPGHLVSFLDKTFCMEPILHCILNHQESNLGLLLHHYIVTSKLGSVSLFTTLVQRGGGGAMMGIDLESHVTEIDAWMLIASGHF